MPDASDAVQQVLEEAAAGGKDAESQSANESSPEVAEALKNVLGSEEGASDDETEDESTEDKGAKTVPYERLAKVVRQKNEFSERYKNLEEKFKAVTEREQELRTRVGNLEQDSQILDAIKNLAQDKKYQPHVVAIDRALRGIDEEIEEAEAKGDQKAESEALRKFEQKTAELDDLIAEQRAESLWDETADLARQMLEALPEQYTEDDRTVLGQLWTSRVDWNKIEAEGSEAIPGVLNSSFAQIIKGYGSPRGAVAAKAAEEIRAEMPESRRMSAEDAIKGILDKPWSKTDENGKPELSDDEFNRDVASLLRMTNKA